MSSYLLSHWVEILGTLCSLIYLLYAIPGKPMLWVWGIISAALYIVVFFNGKFYADMTLQFYYLGISIYGLWKWTHESQNNSREPKSNTSPIAGEMAHSARGVECSRTPLREWIYIIIADIVIFFAYYLVLRNFTDSPLPVCDSLTTALSITATWMLSQKRIEYWLVFVFVDAFSACLYVWRGLYPSAVLFAIYTVMAVLGYLRWRKMLDAEAEI